MGHRQQILKAKLYWIVMNSSLFINDLKVYFFSNRCASNISKLGNLKDDKLYEMKIHDSHIFIQKLIPFNWIYH